MGWCSGTVVFDSFCHVIFCEEPFDKKEAIKLLIAALEDMDWDCQNESDYYDHPIVQEAMKEIHPELFEYYSDEQQE